MAWAAAAALLSLVASLSLSGMASAQPLASTGAVTTVAGGAGVLSLPSALAVSASGEVFVADRGSNRVRRVAPGGAVSTLAGNGTAGFADGPSALFSGPRGLALFGAGAVVVCDTDNHRIRSVSLSTGAASTIAGGDPGFADGVGAAAQFRYPWAAAAAWGGVVVADRFNHRLRLVLPATGAVSTVAGQATPGLVDGVLGTSQLHFPSALAYSSAVDAVFFVQKHAVRRLSNAASSFAVTTLAGALSAGFEIASGLAARFFEPQGVAVDASGLIIVSEHATSTLRVLSESDPTARLFAGGGVDGLGGAGDLDGAPAAALFNGPYGLAVGAAPLSNTSFVYVADSGNNKIRRVSAVCRHPAPCTARGTCIAQDVCACETGYVGAQCQTGVCSVPCTSGRICVDRDTCECPAGYAGPTCATPVCTQSCLNGGSCSGPNTCTCATGWSGANCSTPVCAPSCLNGGVCVAPNTCACNATLWTGAQCSTPVCTPTCANGGTCVSPGACNCSSQYTGARCTQPVCPLSCLNGAQCTAPGVCTCQPGWQGVDCGAPACIPPCLNNGVCLAPGQCGCPTGYEGAQCQNPVCPQGCANGGVCALAFTCACAPGWTGSDCRTPICAPACGFAQVCALPNTCVSACNPLCQNGGVCVGTNQCNCTGNWRGVFCTVAVCGGCVHGECTAPSVCSCTTGWAGANCSEPVCTAGCANGGQCVAPETCACATGWRGPACLEPVCDPACENGAACVAPQSCACTGGYLGSRCETFVCSSPCINGGRCVAPETCTCAEGFGGADCALAVVNHQSRNVYDVLKSVGIACGVLAAVLLAGWYVRTRIDAHRLRELQLKGPRILRQGTGGTEDYETDDSEFGDMAAGATASSGGGKGQDDDDDHWHRDDDDDGAGGHGPQAARRAPLAAPRPPAQVFSDARGKHNAGARRLFAVAEQ